ncbi:MAG: DUF1573 domain-containing protein [Planctomycetota bacterium]
MKRFRIALIITSLSCFLIFIAGCQEQAKKTAEPAPQAPLRPAVLQQNKTAPAPPQLQMPPPQILFEETVHDFGNIPPSSKNTVKFEFKNTGKGVLKIGNIKTTCGCTAVSLEKKEYQPGESGALEIIYTSSSQKGPVSKLIYVSSNDPGKSKVTLTIKANIAVQVDYEPESLNLRFDKENAGIPNIILTSVDGTEFSIRSFTSTNSDCITADFDPSEKAVRFELHPKVDVEKLREKENGAIRISLTHPQARSINIPYHTLAEFETSPRSVILRDSEPNTPVTREVVVKNNYGEDFNIVSTSSLNGHTKVLSEEKLDNRYILTVEITPPAVTQTRLYFRDTLTINFDGSRSTTVQVSGYYVRSSVKDRQPRR